MNKQQKSVSVNDKLSYWEIKLKKLSENFMSNCGLSYDIYQQNFSKSIDELVINLNDDDKKIVIDLARELFDYLSADEIEKQITENEKEGFCQHGLDFDCCPLGCGEPI